MEIKLLWLWDAKHTNKMLRKKPYEQQLNNYKP